jgi:hypothetical protein
MPSKRLKDPRMLLKARSVLLAARDLLSDRSRWTQGTVARTIGNTQVRPTHPLAEQWCAVGAIDREAHQLHVGTYEMEQVRATACELMQQDLKRFEGFQSIPQINDGHGGYEKIMSCLHRLLSPMYLETLTRRSEAAMKGWETRRRIRTEYDARLAAERATAAYATHTMSFGGTLPGTPSINADAKKEITV